MSLFIGAARRRIAHQRAFISASRFFASSNTTSSVDDTFYVTTPIFYPNAAPHIGHLYTLVTADVFARHARLTRPSATVHFITGTDEHGLKIQTAAQARGMEPMKFCDQLSVQFRDLCEKANISHTKFVRTSAPEHHRAVQHMWKILESKGLLYKDNYEGWYSVADECYYTPAQIAPGPEPNSEAFVSKETGSSVVWTREENYKFRLSKFQPYLLEHFSQSNSTTIDSTGLSGSNTVSGDEGSSDLTQVFPQQHHDWVLHTLRNHQLEDLSVSRPISRLEWGIRVPGDPGHTIYVWFDALMSYLSGIGYPWGPSSSAEGAVSGNTMAEFGRPQGWPVNLQIIGKDIVRFHALYWPAMLKALDMPPPRALLTHGHWTMGQRKMSKSVGNVADPLAAIESVGIDCVRYYLMRVGGRFRDDADWSELELEKHAHEITDLLGNFFMRITSKAINKRIAQAEQPTMTIADAAASLPQLGALADMTRALPAVWAKDMEKMEVGLALQSIVNVLSLANQTISTLEPWAKTTPPAVAAALRPIALETLRVSGILLQPFVPGTATALLDALSVAQGERTWAHAEFEASDVGEVTSVKLFERKRKDEA